MSEITYKNGHTYDGALHDINNCLECSKIKISRARYAKNMFAVHFPSRGMWKSSENLEADRLGITNRYSNREHSYIMSKGQVKKLIASVGKDKILLEGDYKLSVEEMQKLLQ